MLFLFVKDYVDFPSWGGQSGHRLEVMPQSKFSGVSGCSDAAVSQGSICSTPTPGDIVIGKNNHNVQDIMLNTRGKKKSYYSEIIVSLPYFQSVPHSPSFSI